MDAMNAAQKKLDEAVLEYTIACEHEGVLTAWVLVGHQAVFEDGEDKSMMFNVYQGGALADHIVLGMLQIAADKVRGVGRWGMVSDEGD